MPGASSPWRARAYRATLLGDRRQSVVALARAGLSPPSYHLQPVIPAQAGIYPAGRDGWPAKPRQHHLRHPGAGQHLTCAANRFAGQTTLKGNAAGARSGLPCLYRLRLSRPSPLPQNYRKFAPNNAKSQLTGRPGLFILATGSGPNPPSVTYPINDSVATTLTTPVTPPATTPPSVPLCHRPNRSHRETTATTGQHQNRNRPARTDAPSLKGAVHQGHRGSQHPGRAI